MANHYIRIGDAGVIIHGYSDAFERVLEGDILLAENGSRHFHEVWAEPLINERGQYRFRWEGEIVERSLEELDIEWNSRPPSPETTTDKLARLELQSAELLFSLAQAEDELATKNAQMGLMLMQLAAIQDGGA